MSRRPETVILSSLLYNDTYLRKVLPFLKPEYFLVSTDSFLFKAIKGFVEKYNKPPTLDVLRIAIDRDTAISEDEETELKQTLSAMEPEDNDLDWLVDMSEKFCRDKALYNAIYTGIQVIDGKSKKISQNALPELFEQALAVGFDTNVGHEYMTDTAAEERFEYYHKVENKIPCDVEILNKITKGGIPRKTLNILMAGVGVGKTLSLCHLAGAYLSQGLNVAYITMEMAQEEIAKRIDANLLNVTLDDLVILEKSMFEDRVRKLQKKTQGRLMIKEFPTASAHVGHFNALLSEWWMKVHFKPDVVIIDYLNICCSSRLGGSSSENSYAYIKAIAEELRGFFQRHQVVGWSATQTTRSGSVSTDVDMTDTAESFGLPATADFMLALMQPEEFESLSQYLAKQLKNRYRNKGLDTRFAIGVDKDRMRLYDVERAAQEGLMGVSTTKGSSEKFKGRDFSQVKF